MDKDKAIELFFDKVSEKFLRYVKIPTSSSENSNTHPSTEKQKVLSDLLLSELKKSGADEAIEDEYGCVYANFAGVGSDNDAIGFISHVDTSPSAPDYPVKPRVIKYGGGDIPLPNGDKISADVFPNLKNYIGKTLITSDGGTLLGADDKAGIAEIMTAVEYFRDNPEIKRRPLSVCFSTDEEIGCGADNFNFDFFKAKKAYTADGGPLGQIEYENFNAANAAINVRGVNIHPGDGKNKMKNAVLLACRFISSLPAAETPSHTEGYEGFYHVEEIKGNETSASFKILIRDHDREKFENRKKFILNLTNFLNSVYGEGTFSAYIEDSYYNMRPIIEKNIDLVTDAVEAFEKIGVYPKAVPIRGGTDGAMLSYKGLPCPNLPTGGENFHGVHEFACVESMAQITGAIINITEKI